MRKTSVLLALSLLWNVLPLTAMASRYLPRTKRRKVSVRFLARGTGFRLGMAGGNQDVYLVLLTTRKGEAPVLAKLVDDFLYYQDALPDEVLRSGKPLHLAVQRWTLCDVPASGFQPMAVYASLPDKTVEDALSSSQPGDLPCYKLDHSVIDRLYR